MTAGPSVYHSQRVSTDRTIITTVGISTGGAIITVSPQRSHHLPMIKVRPILSRSIECDPKVARALARALCAAADDYERFLADGPDQQSLLGGSNATTQPV